MGSYRLCVCFTRKFKHLEVEPPLEVKELFKEYAEGGSQMNVEQFHKFLVGVQGEIGVSVSDAEKILDQVLQRKHHLAKFTRNGLNLDHFYYYLFSSDLNSPISDKVHQDMTKPLSHYFIYTGHNSYLTGNQLSSDCSDKPIIRALMRGVRVIELDLWPNSSRDDINVLHGRTLTKPVDFITCLKSIEEHAFKASPYPVIVTLEDHLTADLQAKAAEAITEIFGEMLFIPECDCLEELPSPEDLKYRIIISAKPPKEYLTAQSVKEKGNASRKDKDSDDDTLGKEPSSLVYDQEDNDINGSDTSEESEDESLRTGVSAYKRLIAIHAGRPKGGFKEKLQIDPNKVRRLSLNEQKLEKATENHGTDVIRFTQKNLLRVFPKSTRFDSSNYDPIVGWIHGAQMVAFNMQGHGRALWLMQGMFRSNGGCGYVRKPDFLLEVGDHGEVFNPKENLQVKKTLKASECWLKYIWEMDGLWISNKHILDKYSPPDFYTRIGIAGVPNDVVMKKSKILEDNWRPVWDEEFTFPLTVPELALLRIEVYDNDMSEKDDFAGQTCLPVSELRSGIRSVPLFDRKGEQYKSVRLLLRIEFV